MNEKSITGKIINGGMIILFFSLITSPLGYFVRMILSRSLSIEMYGLIYASLSFFSILTMFNDLGFGYALIYFIPKYFKDKEYSKIWNLYKYDQYIEVISSVFISFILIFSSEYLSLYFFKHPASINLTYLFCIYLISNGVVSSIQKLLIGLQEERYYSLIEFLRMFFTFLFSLLFFMFDVSNVFYFAFAFVFAYLILSIIYLIIVKRKFSYLKKDVVFDYKLLKNGFVYGFPTFLSSSLYIIINYAGIIFLTYYTNITNVGIYNVILPIATISLFIFEPVKKMIIPLISELDEDNKDMVASLINTTFRLVPFIGLYFSLFIFIFPEGIISMTFGYKWVKLSSNYLKLLSITYVFALLSIYLSAVLNGLGEVKKQLKISLFVALASMLGAAFGAKFYGISGVIINNLIVFLFSIILSYKVIKGMFNIKLPYKLYFKLFIITLLIVFLRYQVNFIPISISSIFLLGVIYTIIMTVVFFKFKIIGTSFYKTFGERILGKNIISKIKYYNLDRFI
jgi:O-antigen/teichoic acid export membrane protein